MLQVKPLVRSQPLQRYTFQMLQASLRGSTFPQTSYSFQPLYSKQSEWAQNTARFSAELYQAASSLGTTASLLEEENQTSIMNQRKASSSDTSKVSVQVSGRTEQSSHAVEVLSLAKAQVNQSLQLKAQEQTSVQGGVNKFTMTVGSNPYLLSIFSSPSDSNAQSLARIADAINAKRTGVKAKLSTHQETGTASLMLTANQTGSKQAFTLEDVEGNAIAANDLNHTIVSAEDALFKVDGQLHHSENNNVSIDDGHLELSFQQTTQEPVIVTVSNDKESIVKQTRQLLDKYNQFYSKLENFSAVSAFDLTQAWDRMSASIQPQLSRIGITRKPDGTFAINEEKLATSLTYHFDTIEQIVGGPGGLAFKIKDQAERLKRTPLEVLTQSSPFADPSNPYQAYLLPNMFLHQAAKTGLFLNRMV